MRVVILGGTGRTGAVAAGLLDRGASPVPLGHHDDLAVGLRDCAAAHLVAPNLHPDEPAPVT